MSETIYKRRKEQGICVRCGKIPSRKGKVMCAQCAEKRKIYEKETRDFYKKMGVCPRCGKNKLFGDEKSCPECLADSMIAKKKSREKLGKTNMDYFRENQEKLKKKGLCRTGCGRKRSYGHTYCDICLIKHRERSRENRKKKNDGLQRYERPSYGLCYICGKPLDREGKICVNCAEKVTKNLPKTRDNKHWKEDNKIIFKNF